MLAQDMWAAMKAREALALAAPDGAGELEQITDFIASRDT